MTTGATKLDVRAFGAAGDGQTDDTAAFQRALDAAAASQGTVFVPDGVYSCGRIRLPPHTGLVGNATWGYRSGGGAVLRLGDPAAPCLLDITGAVGATLNGLSLDGAKLGRGVHGIHMGPFENKREEDSPRIERCHVSRFTGDGIRLDPVWCFSIRSCEVIFNDGNGLAVRGWDGFVLDNWLSGNGGAGYASCGPNASNTFTGNRIEWNRGGGMRIEHGSHYNITGNYIDRSGGPGLRILDSFCITVTGNVIYRSGKPDWTGGGDEFDSCHIRLERCRGLTCTGNSACVGHDDNGQGGVSPRYGMVLGALRSSVVRDNALHVGATAELVRDLGGHGEGLILGDNPGSLYEDRGGTIWESGQL
jgi:hypothetical protein